MNLENFKKYLQVFKVHSFMTFLPCPDNDHVTGVDDPRYPVLGGRGELAAPRGLGLPRPLLRGLPQPAC